GGYMGRRLFSVFSVSITAPIASRSEASFVQVVAKSRNLAFVCGEMALFASCRQRNACLRHSLGSPVMTPPTPKLKYSRKTVRLKCTAARYSSGQKFSVKVSNQIAPARPHEGSRGSIPRHERIP